MANSKGSDRTATDSATPLPPSDRAATLQHLLDDQRLSWLRGQRSRVEDYLQWMPYLATDPVAIVELLVGEFRLQQELGEAPRRPDFEQRFPEHAAQFLRQLIALGIGASDADSADDVPPARSPGGTVADEATSQRSTQVGETGESHSAIDDPTEQGDSLFHHAPTSLIEASEALARELAERQASGRADSPDRSTLVQLLKEALKGSPQSRSKRRAPTPLRAVPGYDILTELGRGSVGVVYKARQAGLNRVVALKMILAGGHASRTTLARFRAEAAAVASLQHGNIVQVYEIGECDGLPYFSLEFCAGGSLADRLQGTPLLPDVAARTVVKLARAMHYAHGCRVVHRDLKPGNILLHPKDDSGRPATRIAPDPEFDLESVILKVSDFGLAKRLDEESQTKTGAILGTPSYMAPEQASGKIHDVGPLADIYALGAVLYELLTGRPPFRAATPLDTVVQVINDEPVPPRRLHSGVPADLETIALKCLQKDPLKRYATAADLADDLQRFLDGEPIVARPVGITERMVRWCRRNPLIASLSGLAATLLIAGTVVSLYFAKQASERAALAETNERHAKAEREIARRSQYVAEMNLIQRAWRDVEMARVRALLQAQIPNSNADTDFRGPEWHYWNRLAHSELATIPCESGELSCLALSPDGLTLASAGTGRTIVLWSVVHWRELGRLTGHTDTIVGLAFLPDGRLVSASTARGVGDRGRFVQGAEIRLWSVAQKVQLELHTLSGDAELEKSVVSPNGRLLAIADRNGTVAVANIADGSIIRSFDGGGLAALSIAFSPDHQRLAASFANGDVTVWNLDSGATVKSFSRPRSVAHCVAFSPEGRRLAIGGSGVDENDAGFRRAGDVRVVDLDSDRVLAELRGHSGPVLHVEFSRDGQRLVSGGNDRTIRIWSSLTGKALGIYQGHERATTAAVFSLDGRIAISAGDDHSLRIWDLSTILEPWPLASMQPIPDAVAIRPDGRLAAHGFANEKATSTIAIVDLPSNETVQTLPEVDRRLEALAFHPTEGRIAMIASGESGRTLAWQPLDGSPGLKLNLAEERISDLFFSPDGRRLVVVASDRSIWFATDTGDRVATVPSQGGTIVAAAFVSNHDVRFASVDGSKLIVWDSTSAGAPRVIETGSDAIVSAAITRDGNTIATAQADRTIRIWNAVSGHDRIGGRLTGHVDKVADLSFSPDGRRLASAGMGYDHTTRIWDTVSGQELLVFTSSSGDTPQLTFANDGHWLAIRRDRTEFLDFRPVEAQTSVERAVVSAARHYADRPMARHDALTALNSDRGLSNDLRASAAEKLSQWLEKPARYERSTWQLVRSPYATAVDYRRALDWSNQQNVATDRHGFVLKGAALFRLGRLAESRTVLIDGDRLKPNDDWDRVRRVFLALIALQMGSSDEAKSMLTDLGRLPAGEGAAELLAELREQLERHRAVSP